MQVHLYLQIDRDRLGKTVVMPVLPQPGFQFSFVGDPFGIQFMVEEVILAERPRATPEEELPKTWQRKELIQPGGCYFEVLCFLRRICLADDETRTGLIDGLKSYGWEEVPKDAVSGV